MLYRNYFKRPFDFVFSLLLLIFLFPGFLIIIIIHFLINGKDIFYIQNRPGKDELPFNLIKFKTMTDEVDSEGVLLPDVKRITKFGAFLRKFSLDEFPQLINVLKGDMSLVGPRPLLFKYIPLYNEQQRKRHLVRPGITGLAQVSGRNAISWAQKFEYDVYYIENVTFLLDLKILLKTFIKVIAGQGINQSPQRPMQSFNGFN